MAIFALLLLSSAVLGDNIDLTYSYYNFAQKWCSGGSIANADVGNGNLAHKQLKSMYPKNANASAYPASLLNVHAIPGSASPFRMPSNPTVLTHSKKNFASTLSGKSSQKSCNEKEGDTCQSIGNRYFWCNYQDYLCMAKYSGVTSQSYNNIKEEKGKNDWVFTQYFHNGLDTEEQSTFSRTESLQRSFTWSLKTTIDVGYSVTVKASIPAIMDVSSTLSFDIKVESSVSQTNTVTQSWNVDQVIKIPAKSTVKATWVIRKQTVTGEFQGVMDLPHYAKVWCNKKTKDHYEWFHPASSFMPQAYPKACSGSSCKISGNFEGWQGIGSFVNVTQCPLNVEC